MFDFFPRIPSTEQIAARKKRLEERLETGEPWTEDIKWSPCLTIVADSYSPPSLFKLKPTKHLRLSDNKIPKSQCARSPDGRWIYTEAILPRGGLLHCYYGTKPGDVCFDGEVIIPRIHQRYTKKDDWPKSPWMSIAPMEILTLRCGTRFAKGVVAIGGLGMGHQLEQVCLRKKVKKVIVVEKCQALIDWVAPQLNLNGKDVVFVAGDARKLIPEMTADAALIDIDNSYGFNTFPDCPNINKLWVWGSAKLSDRGDW